MSTFELFETRSCRRVAPSVPDRALRHHRISAGGEIGLFGTVQTDHLSAELPVPIGGAARGYREQVTMLRTRSITSDTEV
jgi:hypothetical protein